MSRNEDYLDNLLTSVTDKLNEFDDDFEQNRESLKESYQTQNDLPKKTQSALDEIREENFIKEFENELRTGGTEDDFLRQFEQELGGGPDGLYDDLPQTDGDVGGTDDFADHTVQLDRDAPMDDAATMSLGADPMPLDDIDFGDLLGDGGQGDGPGLIPDSPQEPAVDSAGGLDDLLDSPTQASPDAPGQDIGEDVFTQMASGQGEPMGAPEGMEGLEDIFGDLGDLLDEGDSGQQQSVTDSPLTEAGPILDDGLEQILNSSDDEALSEIDGLLNADGGGEAAQSQQDGPLPGGPDFAFDEAAFEPEESGKKKKKEKNPNSLFGRLSHMLFGTPAELDPEAQAEYEAAEAELAPKREAEAAAQKERKQQEKELKKQQKQEAAEQKKQEKEAAKAEKAAKKASKPKKEKKPKSKTPKEPPLPKVPVAMMWILALSAMVLIFLGTSFVGYSSPVKESKEALDKGDYFTAYTKLQGIKLRKTDEDLLHAASALAGVQSELDAYTALMEQKQYEMALDALVRGYGRCALHSAEAEEWGVAAQLTDMEDKFVQLLKEQFDVSKRKAKKLYKIKKRSEYTLALHEILGKLGLI